MMIDVTPNTRFVCMDPETKELFTVAEGHGMPEKACYIYD